MTWATGDKTDLESRRDEVFAGAALALPEVVIAFFERNLLQLHHEVLENHLRLEDVLGEPDHAAARDGGRGGELQVVHLEHDPDVWWKRETFTVGQGLKS